MMILKNTPFLMTTALLAGLASGQGAVSVELRDPATRDEDISATQIEVQVNRLPSGIYEYLYNVISPAENKGRIGIFSFDISCDLDFGEVVYPEPPYPHTWESASPNGEHVPVRPYAAIGDDGTILSGRPGIDINNELLWSLAQRPGSVINGLKLHSPAPPGQRQYRLNVFMNATDIHPDGFGWDYSGVSEDSDVPWIPDFEVTGIIEAPACRLPDDPPPSEPSRFLGSEWPGGQINDLLSYSEPTRDRFHVPAEQNTVDMVIHYHEDIDPKTFHVQPGWAKRFFNPEPGTSERVTLRLEKERNLYQLEVSTQKERGTRKDDARHHSRKDRDVFEIRRPSEPPRGQGKHK